VWKSIDDFEKELKRIEYLRNMGELMEGVTHDLNNLLTTISGLSQLSLLKDASVEVKNNLRVINQTALDGKTVIDKIHNYIRGSYNSRKDYHYFDDIVISSLAMAKHRFKTINTLERHNVCLETDLNCNGIIYCNEYEIRQGILNIILNGIDAIEEKDGILIVRTYNEDNYAVVEISDNGVGIDEETMEKLFEPYFTTKGPKGTGLGLNIVKNILKDHSAEISVESKVGEGTTFKTKFTIVENIDIDEDKKKGYNIV
jgi:signal transduction histidine kinase